MFSDLFSLSAIRYADILTVRLAVSINVGEHTCGIVHLKFYDFPMWCCTDGSRHHLS